MDQLPPNKPKYSQYCSFAFTFVIPAKNLYSYIGEGLMLLTDIINLNQDWIAACIYNHIHINLLYIFTHPIPKAMMN